MSPTNQYPARPRCTLYAADRVVPMVLLVVPNTSPGQNGVRERASGSFKYEHLCRMEIDTLQDLAREAEAYRHVFNHTRPHQSLGGHRPIEIYRNPTLHPQLSDQQS